MKDLQEAFISTKIINGVKKYLVRCPICDMAIIRGPTENPDLRGECNCGICNRDFVVKAPKNLPPTKETKPREKKYIEGIIQTRRIHEVICPECGEIAKDSTGARRELWGEYICEGCDTKFKIMELSTKEDGRGKKVDREVARNNILREIRKSGPISAKRVREKLGFNRVLTKGIFNDLEEEGLIEHISKGWIMVS